MYTYCKPKNRFCIDLCLVFICFLIALCYPENVRAEAELVIPPEYHLIDSDIGVYLYRKDYPGGSPDFVQVIDLTLGARLVPLHGGIQPSQPDSGVYGGENVRLNFRSLEQFWSRIQSEQPRAFCVSNGQFFKMGENPTRLPFPLKIDGEVITEGYAANEFPDQKLILELWEGRARISQLSQEALYASDAPGIIGGLAADANKRAKSYTGRTFTGLTDRDKDGWGDILFILNTKIARQIDAEMVLRQFGAEQIMMLDGGGSSQLTCREGSLVASERLIPQAIATIAGARNEIGGEQSFVANQKSEISVESIPAAQDEDFSWSLSSLLSTHPIEKEQLSEVRSVLRLTEPVKSVQPQGLFQLSLVPAVYIPMAIFPLSLMLLLLILRRHSQVVAN